MKRASITFPPITRAEVRFSKGSSNAFVYDGEEARTTIDAFKSKDLAQKFVEEVKKDTAACLDQATDLGEGATQKNVLSSTGKISQAESKVGATNQLFSEGDQIATFYVVVASKGCYLVEVFMNSPEDAASQANRILAKL